MIGEFDTWLAAVDAHLADIDENRARMPFQLHQWWELWDHCMTPQDAANAAWLLRPGMNAPWPAHAAYSTN